MITYSLVSQIGVLVLLTERVWFMLHCHLCRTCLCCTFSFFGRPYVVYCCKCFTVLYYIYELMNFHYQSCKLANPPNQKSCSYADNGSRSTSMSICHKDHEMPLLFKQCPTFGGLLIRKSIRIVATRCRILGVKCTKLDFAWGSARDPTGGAYSTPLTP